MAESAGWIQMGMRGKDPLLERAENHLISSNAN